MPSSYRTRRQLRSLRRRAERRIAGNRLVDAHGQDFLSEADYAQFRLMGHFVRHVPDILSLVQDTLRPRNFVELEHYGFDGPPQ